MSSVACVPLRHSADAAGSPLVHSPRTDRKEEPGCAAARPSHGRLRAPMGNDAHDSATASGKGRSPPSSIGLAPAPLPSARWPLTPAAAGTVEEDSDARENPP